MDGRLKRLILTGFVFLLDSRRGAPVCHGSIVFGDCDAGSRDAW